MHSLLLPALLQNLAASPPAVSGQIHPSLQHVDMLDQLATAIESEIEQLGGNQQLPADAVLEVAKVGGE
jgi:hypothetical protein